MQKSTLSPTSTPSGSRPARTINRKTAAPSAPILATSNSTRPVLVFVAETTHAAFHRFERTPDGVQRKRRDYMSIGQAGPSSHEAQSPGARRSTCQREKP